MKTGQRSKAGCWTCKLRKKKCDETHPQCSTCQSLKIDCYGYANRPSWMDGGAQERKIVRDLRLRVKETLSQKRRSRTRLGPQVSQHPSQIGYCPFQEVSLAIDIESTSSVAAGCTVGEPDADLAAGDTTCAHEFFPTPATSLASAFAARTKDTYRSSQSLTQVPLDEWEAGLWMHYLDKTFPHQFPFYKPTTREGGRGWLLMLVVQTEPLYHAVLSIASYHQHFELLCESDDQSNVKDCWRADEQLQRYNLALQKLQIYLDHSISGTTRMSKPECLRLLACIVFLISLEVFKSTGGAWKVHLEAAAGLLPRMKTACVEYPEELAGTQISAWQFVAGTLAWYNTLACVSPHPPLSISSEWLCSDPGYLPLARIMGCKDWAISKIRDITTLRTWKESIQARSALSLRDLVLRATEIETSIEDEIKITSMAIDAERCSDDLLAVSNIHDYGSEYITLLLTRIFACAALTYLFAVVSGPNPNLPEIQSGVFRTIAAIRALPHLKFFCNLSWPLCVTGCLSTGDNQEVFRRLMQKYNDTTHHFGSSQHIQNIVEKCWELHKDRDFTSDDVDWTTAMQTLDLDLLLV